MKVLATRGFMGRNRTVSHPVTVEVYTGAKGAVKGVVLREKRSDDTTLYDIDEFDARSLVVEHIVGDMPLSSAEAAQRNAEEEG